ncbi:hypothetical protein DENSPDRAFT_787150 [Dentipellis sp. KUC8613]|nr:hypothetical protein DENSPDRAFT_787150 [Dentipellis sp. KUC8613]
MEEVRGPNRGSYIYGRSVHNIRIERLWVDVTSAFGSKWKDLFHSLELFHGLNVDDDAHIWLLQFLFLDAINADADAWRRAWNNHVLSRRGQPHLTPLQLYTRGTVLHGSRSVFAPVALEDPNLINEDEQAEYSVDWSELDRTDLVEHLREANSAEGADVAANPFSSHIPENMPYIHVPDVDSPLIDHQIRQLEGYIASLPQIYAQDSASKVQVWNLALQYCTALQTSGKITLTI